MLLPVATRVARLAHLSAVRAVNLQGQGCGTHARFRRARPYIPERLWSCRVSQAFACYRNAPCSVRADTRLALPVSPATHPPTPSRVDGHPPARSRCARNEDCLAQRDPRTVRPTSANQSFQRREPGAARRSALSWLSPHPHRWHARFTPRLPRKPSTSRSSCIHVSVATRGAVARPPTLPSSPDFREPGFRPALDCRTT